MSLSKITHLCPLQRLSVLALQVGKFSKLTNRGQVCLENAKEPKAFISALRSLMAAPSGPVISGVNEAGMLSVTGYSCARPRDCDRALHKRLPSTAAAAAAAINYITEQPQSELLKLITLVLDTLLKRTREILPNTWPLVWIWWFVIITYSDQCIRSSLKIKLKVLFGLFYTDMPE